MTILMVLTQVHASCTWSRALEAARFPFLAPLHTLPPPPPMAAEPSCSAAGCTSSSAADIAQAVSAIQVNNVHLRQKSLSGSGECNRSFGEVTDTTLPVTRCPTMHFSQSDIDLSGHYISFELSSVEIILIRKVCTCMHSEEAVALINMKALNIQRPWWSMQFSLFTPAGCDVEAASCTAGSAGKASCFTLPSGFLWC